MQPSRTKLFLVACGTFLMMLCNGIINNSTTYFTLAVTEYLGISKTTFSLYFTIITICSAVMSLIVGPMARRLGPRLSALTACVGVGAGFFVMSRVTSLWMVYAGALLIGIFQAFVVVPTVSVINAWFVKNTGTVTGITMSATGFGGLLMGAIMPSVVANFSWRTGYLICMGLWVVLTVFISFLTAGEPPRQIEAGKGKQVGSAGRELLRTPAFWLLMLSACAISGVSMVSQHMSVLLTANGMAVGTVSLIMGVMSLGLAVFKIVEGSLYDRVPEKVFVPAVLLFGTAGYLALTLKSTPMMIFGVLGYGCSAAACTVLYPIILRRLYGPERATAVWGVCWAMFMLGHAIWTPIYAKVFDMTGSYTPAVISSAVILALIALYLSAQLAAVRRREAKSE